MKLIKNFKKKINLLNNSKQKTYNSFYNYELIGLRKNQRGLYIFYWGSPKMVHVNISGGGPQKKLFR